MPEHVVGDDIAYAFFDPSQFLARVAWQRAQGDEHDLIWVTGSLSRVLFLLAWIANDQGDFDRGIRYLDRALAFEPDNPPSC